jgi:hypothetical protein
MGPHDIRAFAAQLRAEGRALAGDGFGRVGSLKGGFKKTSKQLDDLADELEAPPPEKEPAAPAAANPACMGQGAENAPGCGCREIFESLGA